MKKILSILFIFCALIVFNSDIIYADVAGLTPCKESVAFSKRLDNSIKKLESRLALYTPGTPPTLALQKQIDQTNQRFIKYKNSGVLCGTDGLPHLIADGRWNHAGEFMLPGLLFIYITGFIGWVGRGYLKAISIESKPTEKEIIIDVPLALKCSLSGFVWPLASIQEFTSGQLLASNDDIPISPR
uniref:Photosystem I reaction center subunit III n=1 Tax=Crouania attenuata TaxID=42002 RepID=A0A4D6WSC4_9FLOR|nr:photosystem I reaction center subunit III [Crouania attenuata]